MCPGIEIGTFCALKCLILTTTLGGRHCYYPDLQMKKLRIRWNNLLRFQLESISKLQLKSVSVQIESLSP